MKRLLVVLVVMAVVLLGALSASAETVVQKYRYKGNSAFLSYGYVNLEAGTTIDIAVSINDSIYKEGPGKPQWFSMVWVTVREYDERTGEILFDAVGYAKKGGGVTFTISNNDASASGNIVAYDYISRKTVSVSLSSLEWHGNNDYVSKGTNHYRSSDNLVRYHYIGTSKEAAITGSVTINGGANLLEGGGFSIPHGVIQNTQYSVLFHNR